MVRLLNHSTANNLITMLTVIVTSHDVKEAVRWNYDKHDPLTVKIIMHDTLSIWLELIIKKTSQRCVAYTCKRVNSHPRHPRALRNASADLQNGMLYGRSLRVVGGHCLLHVTENKMPPPKRAKMRLSWRQKPIYIWDQWNGVILSLGSKRQSRCFLSVKNKQTINDIQKKSLSLFVRNKRSEKLFNEEGEAHGNGSNPLVNHQLTHAWWWWWWYMMMVMMFTEKMGHGVSSRGVHFSLRPLIPPFLEES